MVLASEEMDGDAKFRRLDTGRFDIERFDIEGLGEAVATEDDDDEASGDASAEFAAGPANEAAALLDAGFDPLPVLEVPVVLVPAGKFCCNRP
jgi:hypothetical protein